MADETTQADGTAVTAGAEPHGDAQEPERPQVDWKAKYEQAVAESRKWEERSKANRRQADQLKGEADAARTDADRLKELEARVEGYETVERRRALVAKVSADKGLPADVVAALAGDDEETLGKAADTVAKAMGDARARASVAEQSAHDAVPHGRRSNAQDFAHAMHEAGF